jgi:hypothetical protein
VSQYKTLINALTVSNVSNFDEIFCRIEQRVNPKWEVGGKVGIDYFPGGTNRRADVGVGYNINKDTQIRGSIGADNNRFGTNPRAGIGLSYQFGRK